MPDSASQPEGRARNIVQGMGYLTAHFVANSGLGFIFLSAIIRLVPNFQYGIYSAVLVTVSIAATIGGMGLNLAATRFVAFYEGEASWDAARKTLLLSLLITGVTAALYLAISPLLSLYFTKSTGWTWAFLLGGGWVLTASVSNTLQGILQGLKKYAQMAKILFTTRLIMVGATIVAVYYIRSIEIPLVAWIAFYTAISIWIFLLMEKNLVRAKGDLKYSTIMRYALPLGFATIIAAFSLTSDSVIVGGYLNPSSLGIYQAAIQISTVLGVVSVTPLITALFPEISSSKTPADISNGVRLAFRFIAFAVLPLSLFVAAVPSQLLSLFTNGGVYLAGTLTLELIALFYVFVAIQTILLNLLQGVGKTFEVIIIGVVAASTDIGVALLLVPRFGLAGAVTSRVAVALDATFVSIYLCRRYMDRLDGWSFFTKCAVASMIPAALVFMLTTFISTSLVFLVPYALLFSAIYLVCVRQLRLLSNEDRTYLSHILPGRLRKIANFLL